jgi:hypothetical protein
MKRDEDPFDVFWQDHRRDMLDAEYREAAIEAAEHIELGEN